MYNVYITYLILHKPIKTRSQSHIKLAIISEFSSKKSTNFVTLF